MYSFVIGRFYLFPISIQDNNHNQMNIFYLNI